MERVPEPTSIGARAPAVLRAGAFRLGVPLARGMGTDVIAEGRGLKMTFDATVRRT
jgi:hypothetical protein